MSVESDIWTIAGAIYNGLNDPSLERNPYDRDDCAQIAESALYSLQFTDNDIEEIAYMGDRVEELVVAVASEEGIPRNMNDLKILVEVVFDTFA